MASNLILDCDGVLCSGEYIPAPLRGRDTYMALQPQKGVTYWLPRLAPLYNFYVVSSRDYPDAERDLREWWDSYFRIAARVIPPMGIITGIPKASKPYMAWQLRATHVVDDDPQTIEYLTYAEMVPYLTNSILFDNPSWPENQASTHTPRVHSWKELYNILKAQ